MRRDYLLVTGLAFLLFFPFLGGVHLFDWDEVNFAECAREMILTGDWFRPQIDYEPFWEKPPLFFWMQAVSMQVFGINEFAARLPNAVCGIATFLVVYHLGRRLHDRLFGWLWVMAWAGSILPHFYFRSGIIDPWFNLLTFLGLYGFIKFRWQFFSVKQASTFWYKYRALLMGGFLLGLAVLTKGPTAYLVVMLVLLAYWARYRFRNKGYPNHLLLFSAAAALAALAWFGLEVLLHGPEFVKNFVAYQVRLFSTPDAGHRGFFGYHAVVLLLGCFPVSVFALPNIWGDRQPEDEVLESSTLISCMRSDFITWMQLLFWVVLILFSLVTTKIVHYSSLAYFPLTYLGSVTIWRTLRWEVRPRWTRWLLPALGVTIGLAAMALPLAGMHPEWIRPWFGRSAFALEALEADAGWAWWQILPGLVMVAATVAGTVWWNRGQPWKAAEYLYTGGALFVGSMLLFCIRPIEAHSQRAAVEFYESKAGEDCFVKPVGFKSYAHLFYTGKPPVHGDKTVDDYPNLSRGNPGKKVYFVAKAGNLKDLPQLPGCREICRKNGFVFFERPAQ